MKEQIVELIDQLWTSQIVTDEEDRDTIKSLGQKLDEPYTVIFMGAFSSTKSAIINKIVKRELLPEGEDEVNAVIVLIRHGEKESAFVEYSNGDRAQIKMETVGNYIYQKVVGPKAQSIEKVVIHLNEPFLEGIQIMDTPGVNTPFFEHVKMTQKRAMMGDLVFYTALADSGIGSSDIEELTELEGRKQELIVLLTRFDDLVSPVEESVREKISETSEKLEKSGLGGKTILAITTKEGEAYAGVNQLNQILPIIASRQDPSAVYSSVIKFLCRFVQNYANILGKKAEQIQVERNRLVEKKESVNGLKSQMPEVKSHAEATFSNAVDHLMVEAGEMVENAMRSGGNQGSNKISEYINEVMNKRIDETLGMAIERVNLIFIENLEELNAVEQDIKRVLVDGCIFHAHSSNSMTDFDVFFNKLSESKAFLLPFLEEGISFFSKKAEKKLVADIIKSLPSHLADKEKKKIADTLAKKMVKTKIWRAKAAAALYDSVLTVLDMGRQMINEAKKQSKIKNHVEAVKKQIFEVAQEAKMRINTAIDVYFGEVMEKVFALYDELINNFDSENNIPEQQKLLAKVSQELNLLKGQVVL